MKPSLGRWSLRVRLTAAATFVIVVLLSVAAMILVWRVDNALRTSTDVAVRLEASNVAAATRGSSNPRLPPSARTALVQLTDSSGTVLASTPSIDGEPLVFRVPAPAPGQAGVPRTVEVRALDDARYRVATTTTRGLPSYRVYVGLPLAEVEQSVAELTASLAVGVPLLAAAFAGLTWVLAGRALRPVENLRRQAAQISLTDLHRRLEVPKTGDELQRLGTTLNTLIERLDRSLNRQRQFVADAAHELRSPIAAIRAQAEVADHVKGLTDPSALALESARLTHLVDDLLSLARMDAEPSRRRARIDLDDVVLGEVSLLRQSAGVVIDASGVSAVQVEGDVDQLARAVRNLLENAARYASSQIVVTLRAERDTAVLVISDDGPGIPAEDRKRVLERFTRLDETRTRSTGGVGLGLAIVDEVVAAHGGALSIEDAAPGARLVVRLPRA
jgi:signal transduction histidine kinase